MHSKSGVVQIIRGQTVAFGGILLMTFGHSRMLNYRLNTKIYSLKANQTSHLDHNAIVELPQTKLAMRVSMIKHSTRKTPTRGFFEL